MKKFLIVTMVVVMLGVFVSSAPVAAQETDPAVVIQAVYEAVAAKDIDSALALVADDMVLTIIPAPRGTDGTFIGKEEIGSWYEGLAQDNGRAEFSHITVSGNCATWQARWWSDHFEQMGAGPAEFEGTNIVQGDLLKSATWVQTEAFLARLAGARVLEANKKLATRFMEELWNEANLVVADEILSEDFVSYTFPEGDREALKEAVTGFHTRYPEGYFVTDEVIVTADKIMIRGSAMTVPEDAPKGAKAERHDHWLTLLSVEAGQITDRWFGRVP